MDQADRDRLPRRRSVLGSRQWAAFARQVVDYYGGLCWCGHGGARQADHVIPVAERPDLAWDMSNCRPAHGAPGNPCPVCTRECGRPVYCNQLRGPMTIERALRIIAERRAANTPLNAEKPGTPVDGRDAGRDWLSRGVSHLIPPFGLIFRTSGTSAGLPGDLEPA